MYREASLVSGRCPRCCRSLERVREWGLSYQRCRCGGVFVDIATFGVMWNMMSRTRTPPRLELWPRPAIYALPCPQCGQQMARVELLGIPFDHCRVDGLWFDHPELETALMAAALPFHEWLRRFAPRLRLMK
jgi:Zn-finger nucleic acid-binding protein